jgi:F-type H+-transporting ATPase subunit gamma
MAQTLETLARRTESTKGIRSVVHTMKTLSAINAAPYSRAATAMEAYHATVLDGLRGFFLRSGLPKTVAKGKATPVVVVFGTDHGLCGTYNEALAARVRQDVQSATVLCIGAQMADALDGEGIAVAQTFFPPASVDGIVRLANLLTGEMDRIRQGAGSITVTLVYFTREGAGGHVPVIAPVLPLDPDLVAELMAEPWTSRSLPDFTMAPDTLFMALLRAHLFASLYRAAAEALVTENAARLALMQQAEQTIDDRLDALNADTRALRQNEITTELLDVITGFEALKKDRRKAVAPRREQP